MATWLQNIWNDDQGHDVAEYAVMLAVIGDRSGYDPADRFQRE